MTSYGLTTNYGNTTIVQGVGSGTTVESIAATLSNLVAASTYHFRQRRETIRLFRDSQICVHPDEGTAEDS